MPAPRFVIDGNKLDSELLVNATKSQVQGCSSAVEREDGSFAVVWTDESAPDGDTSLSAVRGQIFNADGIRRSSELLINIATADLPEGPDTPAQPGRPTSLARNGKQPGTPTSRWLG